jgi:hypothetical protein
MVVVVIFPWMNRLGPQRVTVKPKSVLGGGTKLPEDRKIERIQRIHSTQSKYVATILPSLLISTTISNSIDYADDVGIVIAKRTPSLAGTVSDSVCSTDSI